MLSLFRRRNPARELALIGHEKARRRIVEKTRQLRRELGMQPSNALEQ